MKVKKIAITSIMLALALIIGFIESSLPPVIPILPYLRIGLANVVILLVIILLDSKTAIIIALLRAILVPIFIGNPIMIFYSLPAGIFSTVISVVLLNTKKLSIVFTSIIGAIIHNVSQLIVACIMMQSVSSMILAPYLILVGVLCGFGVGAVVFYTIKFVPINIISKF